MKTTIVINEPNSAIAYPSTTVCVVDNSRRSLTFKIDRPLTLNREVSDLVTSLQSTMQEMEKEFPLHGPRA